MTYTFGTFAFDSGSLELTRDGRRVALEPQPARGLARLLAGAGELVTRDEMREAIWGSDTHVDYDRGLAYCVGQIRAALGDSGENPRFVQTLPKRGYRFVAPVSAQSPTLSPTPGSATAPATTPMPGPAPAPGPDPGPERRSRRWLIGGAAAALGLAGGWWWQQSGAARAATVAVSIFENENGDPALTSLAPGWVGVIGNAAPLRQPRNIRNLKTLAATLDADFLVLGQLQRQGDDLRFIVHFIRLRDEVHLSAQRFIRPPGEVAKFEGDVLVETERVVRAFVIARAGS
jgi:DNA-binding winged helix-turn-helix (wHTH) protein/TolB-like protein